MNPPAASKKTAVLLAAGPDWAPQPPGADHDHDRNGAGSAADPLEPLAQLFRDLRSLPGGLSEREAARRLEARDRTSCPAAAADAGPVSWLRQLCWPWASGTPRLAVAIAAVILLNADFSFAQEPRGLASPSRLMGEVAR